MGLGEGFSKRRRLEWAGCGGAGVVAGRAGWGGYKGGGRLRGVGSGFEGVGVVGEGKWVMKTVLQRSAPELGAPVLPLQLGVHELLQIYGERSTE